MKPETKKSSRLFPALIFLVVLLLGSPSIGPAVAQVCALPIDPVPTGPLGRTNEPFPMLNFDHRYVHSGTHLQGIRERVKWAGGLIHLPPAGTGFAGMTGAVIVDNPDPLQFMSVRIDYFDSFGTLVGSSFPAPIAPEGHYVEAATPLAGLGFGSARVTVLSGPPLVGATLQHTTSLFGIVDQDRPLSTLGNPPGATSMQQLQLVQDSSTTLWWGPMPISVLDPSDFLNTNIPWFHVVNPNNLPNTVQVNVSVFDRAAGVNLGTFPWRNVTIPAFGTLSEISGAHLLGAPAVGLFNQLASFYGTPGIDWDVSVNITSDSGLPILGDGYLLDVVGPNGNGSRFRMASTMLASTPQSRLISPELSFQQPGGIIETLIGVTNVGAAAGPINIEYFDNNGNLLSAANVPVLLPNQSLRIEPGALNYPAGTSGFGWARITGCIPNDDLVGWTVREITPANIGQQYHKAYGELLLENNGVEPGRGWVVPTTGLTRKVSPWVWVDSTIPSFPWPGYTTFGNFSVNNIGPYNWSFWSGAGANCGFTPFNGVPFGNTSWTYEDPLTFCGGPINLTGRVDHRDGEIEGIDVIGDPVDEYRIPGFGLPSDEVPTYEGPGDIVPNRDVSQN